MMSQLAELGSSPASFVKPKSDYPRSIYAICTGIFLLAFVIRIGLLLATKSYLSVEHSELVLIAMSLAHGHGFANAFGNTGPTAHSSPLYPFILSLVYRWFGTGVRGEIAQETLSCFFGSLVWGLVPLLGKVCELDKRVGIGAAVAGAVLTINRWSETKGSSEAAMAGVACMVIFTYYMKRWYAQDFSVRTAIFGGILSGLAISVSASLGSVVLGLLLVGYALYSKGLGWRYARYGLVTIVVIVVTLLPWALRNYYVLGGLVWTRSNLPLELMVSNNDYARPTLDENQQAGIRYHPFMSPQQRAVVKSMGELPYQQMWKRQVLLWIRTHPKQFAWLTLQHVRYFWFPEMKRPIQTFALGALLLISIPGLLFLLKQKQPVGYGLLTVWVMFPLVYYVVQSHPRYVYPIQWTLYLLSSYSVVTALDRWKTKPGSTSQALAA